MKKKIKNITAKISERIAQWLVRHISISDIAYHIDVESIADYCVSDIAYHIDVESIAEHYCVSDIASHIDVESIADYYCVSEIAAEISDSLDYSPLVHEVLKTIAEKISK